MEWPVVITGLLAAAQLVNIFLSNRTRADIAELKAAWIKDAAQSEKELRAWVDDEFVRKDTCYEAMRCRLSRHPLHLHTIDEARTD